MDYLESCEPNASKENRVLPAMILLDLNLPGMKGREVLAEIKSDDFLRCIPVIVLTMSANQSDIDECYQLGVNAYVVKPLDLDEFFSAIASFKDYWLNTARLPGLKNR